MGGKTKTTLVRVAITWATEVQKRPRILARYVSLSFPFTLTEDVFDTVSIAKLVNDNDDELITSFEFCHFLLGDFYELWTTLVQKSGSLRIAEVNGTIRLRSLASSHTSVPLSCNLVSYSNRIGACTALLLWDGSRDFNEFSNDFVENDFNK